MAETPLAPYGFRPPPGCRCRGWAWTDKVFFEEYTPGRSIKFRFTGPKGFDGFHGYEIGNRSEQSTVLRHTVNMSSRGPAVLSWALVYRPMHDALLEDSLATAQATLGRTPEIRAWSLWVKALRWVVSGGKAPRQVAPHREIEGASAPTGRRG